MNYGEERKYQVQAAAIDKEGFLKTLNEWNPGVAKFLAENEHIQLNDDHWEIIYLLREFYQEFDLSPAMRPLVKYIQQSTDELKGSSIYLLKLFPGSPAKIASKIAGLPKPENCL